MKVLVEVRTAFVEQVDVKGVARFEISAVEKGFTFLEQEIVCRWAQDDFFGFAGNGLFDDLRFQDAPANSSQINAEERLLICKNPMLGEA